VVEHAPHFRDWFLDQVRRNTSLRSEQLAVVDFEIVPDRDMAGARGAAISAMRRFERGQLGSRDLLDLTQASPPPHRAGRR
jgi:hypothetical protein